MQRANRSARHPRQEAQDLNPAALAAAALVSILTACAATPPPHRSSSAVAAFKRDQLCPSTGEPRGPCPGYVVDHITPLCAGGADAPSNMQWQTVADAKVKDRDEGKTCRELRRSQGR